MRLINFLISGFIFGCGMWLDYLLLLFGSIYCINQLINCVTFSVRNEISLMALINGINSFMALINGITVNGLSSSSPCFMWLKGCAFQ